MYTIKTTTLPLVTLTWTSEESIVAAGHEVAIFVDFVCEVASGLLSALQELESVLRGLDVNLSLALDDSSARELSSFRAALDESTVSVRCLAQKVASTYPLLLKSMSFRSCGSQADL